MNRIKFLIIIIAAANTVLAQSIDMKIMSFNVQQPFGNNWEERRDSSVAILKIENPDIIGTQEAINAQRKYLIDSTGNYNWFGLGRDGGDNGEGSWIFYKKDKYIIDSSNSGNFWLSDTPDKPSRFGGDYNRICTYVRLIDSATQRGFYVFNAHFPTSDLNQARLKSIKLMATYMAEKALENDPVLATGDFNSPETDAVTKWMKTGNDNPFQCRDSYRDIYPTGSVVTGFGTKFDYIYYENNGNYITHNSWVVKSPSGASDHMPIVAEISILFATDGNMFPLANAGTDQFFIVSKRTDSISIQLDASASFDTDGIIDSYTWTLADTILANGINPTISLPVGNYPIYLTVTDSLGATTSDQVLIIVAEAIGIINNETFKHVQIYPNPAIEVVSITSVAGNIEKIKVFNAQGVFVFEKVGTSQIDMQELNAGLYIMQVTINGKNTVIKVIKE